MKRKEQFAAKDFRGNIFPPRALICRKQKFDISSYFLFIRLKFNSFFVIILQRTLRFPLIIIVGTINFTIKSIELKYYRIFHSQQLIFSQKKPTFQKPAIIFGFHVTLNLIRLKDGKRGNDPFPPPSRFARRNKNSKGISIKLKISKMHGDGRMKGNKGIRYRDTEQNSNTGISLRVIHRRFEYVKSKHTRPCSVNVRKSRAHNRNLGRAN